MSEIFLSRLLIRYGNVAPIPLVNCVPTVPVPNTYFGINAENLAGTLKYMLIDYEKTLHITYQPQAVFRVRGVTRCTSSLTGR